jgi:hypothetical protein
MHVLAIDAGQHRIDGPIGAQWVVDRANPVAVPGEHFVVMPMNLADPDLAAAGHRLVLRDALVAQIEARRGLGPDALDIPVRVDRAERRAARCCCAKRRAQSQSQ